MKIIFTYIIIILAVLGIGYWLFNSSNKSQNSANQPGTAYTSQGNNHITEGTHWDQQYNSNPPTSGAHWPQPLSCGNYDSTQPDEAIIHNLEHGAIWISYKSSVDDQTKNSLKDYANRYTNVVIEPRDGDDANIALAAWGHLENLDSYDEGKIVEFINAYMDHGPEAVPCTHM